MRYPSEIPPNTRIGIALSCVDFLPTLNGVLDLQISEVFNGRDASQWFRGNPPPSWNDITFLRSSQEGIGSVRRRKATSWWFPVVSVLG